MENWIPVSEIDGFYEVSDHGRVRRAKPGRGAKVGKILANVPDKDGYQVVTLHISGRIINRKVHRLVATEFIANPRSLPEVNHKDGHKEHNQVHNLEWCLHPDNQKHAGETGLMARGSRNGIAKLTDKDAADIRSQGNRTNVSLAREYGVSPATISLIMRRAIWKHV